ncbi:MAG: DUF4175 family protein [bacterium]
MTFSSTILQDILKRLQQVRSLQYRVELQAGIFLFGILTLLIFYLCLLAELAFQLSSPLRTFLFYSFFLLVGIGLIRFILMPILRWSCILKSLDDFDLAQHVGASFPTIRDRLFNLLQLHREVTSGNTLYSPELVDASFQDLAENVSTIDFTASVDTTPVTKALKLFAFCLFGAFVIVITAPSVWSAALYRIWNYTEEFAVPAEYSFELTPGNKEIVKGQSVELTARVFDTFGSRVAGQPLTLFWKVEGQETYDQLLLQPDSTGMVKTTMHNIRATTSYFAQLRTTQSARCTLTVIDRPLIRSFQVRLEYPSYAKLPPRVQEEFVGDITALAGTQATIMGTASKDILSGRIVLGTLKPVPLSVQAQRFSITVPIDSDAAYHLELIDHEHLTNADPIQYSIKVLPDELPIVSIIQPGRNLDIAGDQFLRLIIQAKDDFGLSSMRLGHRLIQSRYEKPAQSFTYTPIPLPSSSGAQIELPFTWDLSKMSLVPEDAVEYFVEVFDNDNVRGPKSSRSSIYLIRLPSLEEVFKESDKAHEQSLDDLKQTLEAAKQLKEKVESISLDMKRNKEMGWQQQKKVEEMSKQYQEIQKELNNVNKRLDDMVQSLDRQNVLSKETLEKYLELDQLLSQMNSAELQQVLKQMQQSMQNVNRDQLRQELQKMSFSEEQFRSNIERTIELLKRIQIEQKFDEVRKRTEEIAAAQRELNEKTADTTGSKEAMNDLARRQSDLAAKQQRLQEESVDLQKKMEEFFTEMPSDRLDLLNQQIQGQNLPGKMQQTGQMMMQGKSQQAQKSQKIIEESLGQIAKEFSDMQQQMLQQQQQYIMNEFRRLVNNILDLSKKEEELKTQSQNAPANSPQFRQNAQDQVQIMRDMENIVNSLGDAARRSFAVTPDIGRSIGEAYNAMRSALEALETRNSFYASQQQVSAMAALNKAASQIQKAMQSAMQGGGGTMGGLMGQLLGLAGRQEMVNEQTQSMQAASDAARLALEQEAIRKSLEQLNREAQASGDQQKLLGDLDRIGDEMQEVIRNLEQNDVNPETIRRQDRILSRLLDASKSMRERDYEKRRKATTGTDITRRSPNELDPTIIEGRSRLLEDLQKALEQGYTKDYQELIRKYFDALQKAEGKR